MPTTITHAQLRKAGACKTQLDLFKTTFGPSVKVTEELAASVAAQFDWEWCARSMLSAPALAEYDRVTAPARRAYARVRASARAEYDRVTAPAWAEYARVRAITCARLYLSMETT